MGTNIRTRTHAQVALGFFRLKKMTMNASIILTIKTIMDKSMLLSLETIHRHLQFLVF